jgi:MinD-like ATPase involved in chromosome partitioning or flagellar assembly
MIRIGVVAGASLTGQLAHTASDADVECDLELGARIHSNGDSKQGPLAVDGLVVELAVLSLRLVAWCDAHAVPFVVLAPSSSSESIQAFGVTESLPLEASWPEILEALNLNDASDQEDDVAGASREHRDAESQLPAVRGRVIAVWGAAGSPGRSVVALNIASERAIAGERVLLIDADTYGGSLAAYLELFDEAPGFLAACRLASMDALTESELQRLSHVVDLPGAHVHVLTGMVNARRWPELSASRVREGLDQLRSHFDVIVADVGFNLEQDEEIASDLTAPRRNQTTIQVIQASDEVVAVLSADVIGVARFIQAREYLTELFSGAPLVVANRVRSHRSSSAPIVRHTLGRFAGIHDVHIVDEDATAFGASLDAAAPLCIAAPKSQVRKQLRDIAERVSARHLAGQS